MICLSSTLKAAGWHNTWLQRVTHWKAKVPIADNYPGPVLMFPELLVPVFLEEWHLFPCCFQNGGFGRHRVDRQGSSWLNWAPGEGWCLREDCQRVTDGRRGDRDVQAEAGKTAPRVNIKLWAFQHLQNAVRVPWEAGQAWKALAWAGGCHQGSAFSGDQRLSSRSRLLRDVIMQESISGALPVFGQRPLITFPWSLLFLVCTSD